MSSNKPQSAIQEPIPLRPTELPSVTFHESLHVPSNLPRPISQETTYTDRTSRRGSLETNPPYLSPGEDAQILTARLLNFRQVPKQSLKPPHLERPAGVKKWVAWCFIGCAGTAVLLLLVTIVLLIFFGLKKHTATVYVHSMLLTSPGSSRPTLAVSTSTGSLVENLSSSPSSSTAIIITNDVHTSQSTFETKPESIRLDAIILSDVGIPSLAGQRIFDAATAALAITEMSNTTTITAFPIFSTTFSTPDISQLNHSHRPRQHAVSATPAAVNITSQFNATSSGGVLSRLPGRALVTLPALLLTGCIILIC